MKLSNKTYYYLILHLTVVIWGFTGILGKLINMPSSSIVLDRMLIAFITLLIVLIIKKRKEIIFWRYKWQMLFVGFITAAHWALFFEAIKVSNISITLCCLASCSFFIALIQPLFLKTRLKLYEIILGLFVILAIYIIFSFENKHSLGIILSLFSAFFAAIFSVWNSVLIKHNSSLVITLYEMLGGTITMLLYLLMSGEFNIHSIIPNSYDWFYILVLGVICTALAFLLGTEVLKELSPFTVSICVNLEPIYAILLALWIFGESEIMSIEFYVGAAIIITTIILNAFFKAEESE